MSDTLAKWLLKQFAILVVCAAYVGILWLVAHVVGWPFIYVLTVTTLWVAVRAHARAPQ